MLRSTKEGYVFTRVCVSVHTCKGGVPHLRSGGAALETMFLTCTFLDCCFYVAGTQSERLEFTTTRPDNQDRKGKGSCENVETSQKLSCGFWTIGVFHKDTKLEMFVSSCYFINSFFFLYFHQLMSVNVKLEIKWYIRITFSWTHRMRWLWMAQLKRNAILAFLYIVYCNNL